MSALGDYVNENMRKALNKRGQAQPMTSYAGDELPSQSVFDPSGPSEIPDISRSIQIHDNPVNSGLIDGSFQGAKDALQQRQKQNTKEIYPATEHRKGYHR